MIAIRRIVPVAIGASALIGILAPEQLCAAQVVVSSVSAVAGERDVEIEITVEDADSLAGGDLTLSYDPLVMTEVVVTAGELSSGWLLAANTEEAGVIRVSMAGQANGEDGGTLFRIRFDIAAGALPGDSTAVNLTDVALYNQQAVPLDVSERTDGSVAIVTNVLVTTVQIEVVDVFAGTTARIPVLLTNARGVAGADLTILYDSTLLTAKAVDIGDIHSETWDLRRNLTVAGEIRIALASSEGANGDTLVWLQFEVAADVEGSADIQLDAVALYDEDAQPLPVQPRDGRAEVILRPPLPMVSEDPETVVVFDTATLTPTLTWTATSPAQSYQLQVSTDLSFDSTLVSMTVISTQITLPTLARGTPYYWRVRSQQDGIDSDWTLPRSFSIAPDLDAPGSPVGLRLADDGSLEDWSESAEFTLTWDNPADDSGIARVHYRVGEAPTSASDTTGSLLATGSLALTLESDGEQEVYVWLEDGAGNTDHGNTESVTLKLDITAPLVDWTPDDVELSGPLAVSVRAEDSQSGIAAVTLFFKEGGKLAFSELEMTNGDADTYEASIPGNRIGERGVDYYVRVVDVVGQSSLKPKGGATNPFHTQIKISDLAAPDVFPTRQWRMVSVPVQPDNNSPFSLLDALGPYDTSVWRLFRFFGDGYKEFRQEDIGNFEPGRAFWLHSRVEDFRLASGVATTTRAEQPFETVLEPGWNDIANPFPYSVRWDDILAVSENTVGIAGPFLYDGMSWSFPQPTTNMDPWEGYAVNNATSSSVVLGIPPIETGQAQGASKPIAKDGWTLQIQVLADDAGTGPGDVNNFLGFRVNADPEWDAADLPEPPAPPGPYVRLFFPHHNWQLFPNLYTSDFRPESDGQIWDFLVEAIDVRTARLQFAGVSQLPPGLSLQLIDADHGTLRTLIDDETIPIGLREGTAHSFQIAVGTVEFAEEIATKYQALPDNYVLLSPRPNPFNAETSIVFETPERSEVALIVYDALGQAHSPFGWGRVGRGISQRPVGRCRRRWKTGVDWCLHRRSSDAAGKFCTKDHPAQMTKRRKTS